MKKSLHVVAALDVTLLDLAVLIVLKVLVLVMYPAEVEVGNKQIRKVLVLRAVAAAVLIYQLAIYQLAALDSTKHVV
jgi:hypothetical protein